MSDDDTTTGEREEDPFDELDDPRSDAGDATRPADESFIEMSVDELDEDAIFEELADGQREEDQQTAVVPKRSYCERCEFFSTPPEVRCTNAGTEIRELVDTDHFRVVDCPVVERRRGVDVDEALSDR